MWRNSENCWGWVSILIHWLSAAIVIGLFGLGLWMVDLTYYDEWYRQAPFIHKSVGMIFLLLILFRLLWRKISPAPQYLQSHTSFERKIAVIVHSLLYALMLLIMLSGYLISTADGRGIDVFGWFEVPAIIYGLDAQEDIAGDIHLVLAVSLIVLVVLHMVGALKHHFIDRDSTLTRMLGIR